MTERTTFSFRFCTINGLEERNTLGMITNIITESMIREKEEKKHRNNNGNSMKVKNKGKSTCAL